MMRPGQIEPNEFELAILSSFVRVSPSLLAHINRGLHVLSRKFTGVGSHTNFHSDTLAGAPEEQLGLNHAEIRLPSVPSGLGAVLFCGGGYPSCLELFTYGDELWDGVYEGFSIHETPTSR
jgi:hypothetical protein